MCVLFCCVIYVVILFVVFFVVCIVLLFVVYVYCVLFGYGNEVDFDCYDIYCNCDGEIVYVFVYLKLGCVLDGVSVCC